MLALDLFRALKCPCGCGQDMADTTSDEAGGPQFVASRVICRARLALIEAKRGADDPKNPSPYAGARLWQVEKR